MSLYLEPALYKRLRERAHLQDTKMQTVIVEGLMMALAAREKQYSPKFVETTN